MIPDVMIMPHSPARRSWFMITAIRLRRKPSGVATNRVNPPRVEMGDPHPGLASISTASIASGASDT